MYAYGKEYIMGMMKKQGEVSDAPEGALHREGLDQMLVGMPRPKCNTVDPAVFRMADEKDY